MERTTSNGIHIYRDYWSNIHVDNDTQKEILRTETLKDNVSWIIVDCFTFNIVYKGSTITREEINISEPM